MSISSNEGKRVALLAVTGAVGTTPNPTYASGTPDVIPEMSVLLQACGLTHVSVQFDGTFELQVGDAFVVSIFRNGTLLRSRTIALLAGVSITIPIRIHAFVMEETEGVIAYDVRWECISGAARAYGIERNLAVVEVPATVAAYRSLLVIRQVVVNQCGHIYLLMP